MWDLSTTRQQAKVRYNEQHLRHDTCVTGILLITCRDGLVFYKGDFTPGTNREGWGTDAVLKTCVESTTANTQGLMMSFRMRDKEAVEKAAQADQEEQELLETTTGTAGQRAPERESKTVTPTQSQQ
jgi:hypothetical protein